MFSASGREAVFVNFGRDLQFRDALDIVSIDRFKLFFAPGGAFSRDVEELISTSQTEFSSDTPRNVFRICFFVMRDKTRDNHIISWEITGRNIFTIYRLVLCNGPWGCIGSVQSIGQALHYK